MYRLRILLITLLTVGYTYAQRDVSVEKIYKEWAFIPKSVEQFNGLKDGEHFIKRTNKALTVHKITQYDQQGETMLNLDQLFINEQKLQVTDVELSEDETKLLLITDVQQKYRHSFLASYFVYDFSTNTLQSISSAHDRQSLATFSPDGKYVAYVSDNNLFVSDLEQQTVLQITNDGNFHTINGATDWVYEEEFGLVKGFCWSPDSRQLAFLKFDQTYVHDFSIEYNYGEAYPMQDSYKYPKAGFSNSIVSVHLYSLDDNRTEAVISTQEEESPEYIPRLHFLPGNNTLIIQTLNRHQNHFVLTSVRTEKKREQDGTESTELMFSEFYTEKNKTYIDIHDNLVFLNDGKSFLFTSERDGYNHIYRIALDGTIKQITNGSWDVIEIYGTDDKNQFVYYSATKTGATEKGIYKSDLKKQTTQAISLENGYNDAFFTKGMRYFVKKYSNANTPPIYTLCDNNGKELSILEDNNQLQSTLKEHEFSPKEFLTFNLDGRSLNGWMIKPRDFDSTKRYPVYMSIYGGPGSSTVLNAWDGSVAWHQLLAQNGYIVVSVDPRGTKNRGKTFKDLSYLQLGKYELEDFVDVAKLLKTYAYIDSERIGIQGWSYGGFMTSLAMTKGQGTFKMGIAVAPVTNWFYYDNIYTERFMRTPEENLENYLDNSPLYFANGLEGKYLLIHGSADDNVHVQNSLEMINALVKANKQFDFFVYPNRNHGIYGGNTRTHLYTMMLNYVLNNL